MAAEVETWSKVILFGDSISQYSFSRDGCWGALLADYLQRQCDVVTRGFAGYTVRECKELIPKIVTEDVAKELAAITVMLGANDRVLVPLEEYRQGMETIVQHLLSVGVTADKIILITFPACSDDKGDFKQKTEKFAKACIDVAEKYKTRLVDFYHAMFEVEDWPKLLKDGVHLSSPGSHLLFELLRPVISQITTGISFKYWN